MMFWISFPHFYKGLLITSRFSQPFVLSAHVLFLLLIYDRFLCTYLTFLDVKSDYVTVCVVV